MSVESETFYDIRCDHPGCERHFVDELYDGEAGWLPRSDLDEGWRESAEEKGWKGTDGVHYCDAHADLHDVPDTDPVHDPTPPPTPMFETETL